MIRMDKNKTIVSKKISKTQFLQIIKKKNQQGSF